MNRDRVIQIVAIVVIVAGSLASGRLLPAVIDESERNALRYTNNAVEGAPPWVALGTAIGALRGVIVDYLWIKVHIMKEKGLFYEVMACADLITKLQPRFASVWAFHGHNMAYNVSVATHTLEERWEWVNAGIRLVRNEGIRHNPNDMVLHKELAFWFGHKIDGVTDDAHLYYKTQFCREWNSVLGAPPEDYEAHKAWIKEIADAPASLVEAEKRSPGVKEIVEKLRAAYPADQMAIRFALDKRFLQQYALWEAVNQYETSADILGFKEQAQNSPYYRTFNEVATSPEYADAWRTLVAHVRRRVLEDEYNMDPSLMYQYTDELGPLDWRHPQSHALYWSRKGSDQGQGRVSEHDIFKILNTDRMQLHAMQSLARSGRMTFDPLSNEMPGRFPDPRWIDVIELNWDKFYLKHQDVRGWGPDTFIAYLENFMGSAIREWYRAGERERAERLMKMLDERFGSGQVPPSPKYQVSVENFVKSELQEQIEAQPHIAPSEVAASLRYGLRVGIGQGRPEVYEDALAFAAQVTEYFKKNDWFNYTTKFGTGRIADIIGQLENSAIIAFIQLMTDPTVPMRERQVIWSEADKVEPELRLRSYDMIAPSLSRQFTGNKMSQLMSFDTAFPQPAGLEAYRIRMAAERAQQQQQPVSSGDAPIQRK
jgi:hypothetical protein